jgi:hypothetical protein
VVNQQEKYELETPSQPREWRQSKEKIGVKEIDTDSIGGLRLGGREVHGFATEEIEACARQVML